MSSSQHDPRPGQDDSIGGDAREGALPSRLSGLYGLAAAITDDEAFAMSAWLKRRPTPDPEVDSLADLRPAKAAPAKAAPPRPRAPDLLAAAADTFRQRNATYGDNYLRFGDIMMGMFPRGLELRTAADFNRYGQLFMCMCKLTRYAENFQNGGHQDSAHDLAVYAAMLEEMTA